jgi:hypothetical protein
MNTLKLAAVAAALLLPAACASYETTGATTPTVSFQYSALDEAEDVAEKADDYCDDRYDTDAYLIDTDEVAGGYEATFSCR